jgi:2,4-dienoyl-CoA reductase-like NADH-dependent reductase (Old Yellow Enzyme family)/NADPH-dependent 2,4-dienoyl-CoA reductase/sulfur reductase-like enzyme
MRKLEHLSKPIKIGKMQVKNRIVMAPTGSNFASEDGSISATQIAYHIARAKGGIGLTNVEDTTITGSANYIFHTTGLFDDRFIAGWKELAKGIHAAGAKLAPQLIHPSFNARASLSGGNQPVAASPIASRVYREIPRELTPEEIAGIVKQFGDAAFRAKQAGCDGIQLHCAHTYHLLGSFLSPLYNKRTDGYGGSVEARLRITLEVVEAIHSKAGADFPILIRISGSEYEPGGLTIEETQYIAKLLEEAGVSAIHVSGGSIDKVWQITPVFGGPPAVHSQSSEAIKKVVNIPVILVGQVDSPWLADELIAQGKTDMVAMARPLIADPEYANKALSGNLDDIRPCLRDMTCLMAIFMDQKITCMMNPAVGKEAETELPKTQKPKKVLVVGGGPGGLEAARIAALRGHEVTLMEKGAKVGGQYLLAAVPPTKHEFTLGTKYLTEQAKLAGVKVELNREVTAETVKEFKPDAVVIATGGKPWVPDMPGTNRENVLTAWDVLSGKNLVCGEVLVIGGGLVGCETADFIAHPVNDMMPGQIRVTIVEMLDNLCMDELGPQRALLIQRLTTKGVKIITGAKCTEIVEDGIKYMKSGKEDFLRGFSCIVLAMGTVSNEPLSEALKGSSFPVYIIGDAKKPRRSKDAIAEGWEIGRSI